MSTLLEKVVDRQRWCNIVLTVLLLLMMMEKSCGYRKPENEQLHKNAKDILNSELSQSEQHPGAEQASAKVIAAAPICKGSTFCEHSDEYPTELIRQQLEMNPGLFHSTTVDAIHSGIPSRIDGPEPEALCIASERIVYPKSGETFDKTWKFIVNQGNFTQGVRIETCMEEDNVCKVIDGFAEGYATACKQKYIFRQLSAVASDGTISREYFRFPASCCCHVQFTGEDSYSREADI